MSILLARARLRGIYAIIAGAIIVLVIPFFEGSILAETGYLSAVNHISNQHDFGPYLTWVVQNQDTDVIFHGVQFLAFLLAVPLPAILVELLWATPSPGRWVARISGQVGFAAYAVAVLLGLLVSGNNAASYADAVTTADQISVAANFGSLFALQNILSHLIGGVLVAVGIMIIGARMMRNNQKTLPGWLGYFAVLVVALQVITALQFAAEPAAAETSLSSLSLFALALWLIAVGIYLARLSALSPVAGAGHRESAESETPSSQSAAGAAAPDSAPGPVELDPQSGSQ